MPKLPTNMIKRSDRPGYWFQKKVDGQRVREYLGEDFEEAKRKLARLQSSDLPRGGPVSVAEAAAGWLKQHVAFRRNARGQALAQQRVDDFLLPELGRHLVSRLTEQQVKDYRFRLMQKKLALQTVKHILADLRSFLNWCVSDRLVAASPFPRSGFMPRIDEVVPDRLTDEEAQSCAELPGHHGFVCRLALGSGLRWGELCRLQAADVDRKGLLTVRQSKSGRVRRVQLSEAMLAEVRGRVGRLVPFSEQSPGSFSKAVKTGTGIEDFHVHRMRHTFACQWVERGCSLAALKEVLGHRYIETTERYGRTSDTVVSQEAARFHAANKVASETTRRTTIAS